MSVLIYLINGLFGKDNTFKVVRRKRWKGIIQIYIWKLSYLKPLKGYFLILNRHKSPFMRFFFSFLNFN